MASFRESMTVYVKKLDETAARALAAAAHEAKDRIVREQTGRYGVSPGVVSAVDGVRGRAFEAVKPDGMIWMGFDYMAEAAFFALDRLVMRSPVSSGEYQSSHFALLDGKALPPLTPPDAASLAAVTKIVITNPVAYSRRLEVGLDKSGRPFVKQVAPHIYESVAQTLRRAYGAVVKVEFAYVDLANAYQGGNAYRHYRMRRNFDKGRIRLSERTDRELKQRARVRYPAIVLTRKTQ